MNAQSPGHQVGPSRCVTQLEHRLPPRGAHRDEGGGSSWSPPTRGGQTGRTAGSCIVGLAHAVLRRAAQAASCTQRAPASRASRFGARSRPWRALRAGRQRCLRNRSSWNTHTEGVWLDDGLHNRLGWACCMPWREARAASTTPPRGPYHAARAHSSRLRRSQHAQSGLLAPLPDAMLWKARVIFFDAQAASPLLPS